MLLLLLHESAAAAPDDNMEGDWVILQESSSMIPTVQSLSASSDIPNSGTATARLFTMMIEERS